MRTYILIFVLLIPGIVGAQKVTLLKDYKIDNTNTLIGINPYYDKSETYKRFSFIVNGNALDSLKHELVFTKKVEPEIDFGEGGVIKDFDIYLIKDDEVQSSWLVTPRYSNIATGKGFYFFDTTIISNLSSKHKLNYRVQVDTFQSREEYYQFQKKSKSDSSLLFLFPPDLDYEGTFDVQIIKKTTLPDPPSKEIDALEKLLNKITSKDKYHVTYVLNDINLNDPNQITLAVEGSKDLFDKFSDQVFVKKNWKASIVEVISFWKM